LFMEYLWIYYRNDKELTFEKRFWMWFEPCILYPFKLKVESIKWKENAKLQRNIPKAMDCSMPAHRITWRNLTLQAILS